MKKKIVIYIGLAIFISIAIYIYELNIASNEKKEWAIMQTIESDNSHSNWRVIREPLGSSLILLGLKTSDTKTPFVWIALNKKDEIKVFPSDSNFQLSCSDFNQIKQEYIMTDKVELYLKGKCE